MSHRVQVLTRYKQLLQLLKGLPQDQQLSSLSEARSTTRQRLHEQDPQLQLDYLKELVSRIGYLRIITPKSASTSTTTTGRGVYVLREGKLVEGTGHDKGDRWVALTVTPSHVDPTFPGVHQ